MLCCHTRPLNPTPPSTSLYLVGAWIAKRSAIKAKKLNSLVSRIEKQESSHSKSVQESRFSWSVAHNSDSKFVIFTISLKDELSMKNVQGFVGTARKAGFDGDIVLAAHPKVNNGIKKYLQKQHVSVYGLDVKCTGSNPREVCTLHEEFETNAVPIAMLRFYIYQWWAMQYDSSTVIMLSDFRDVFFQANPFAYKFTECKKNYIYEM